MDKINFAKEDPSLLGEEKNELFYLSRHATRSSSYSIQVNHTSAKSQTALRAYPSNSKW